MFYLDRLKVYLPKLILDQFASTKQIYHSQKYYLFLTWEETYCDIGLSLELSSHELFSILYRNLKLKFSKIQILVEVFFLSFRFNIF